MSRRWRMLWLRLPLLVLCASGAALTPGRRRRPLGLSTVAGVYAKVHSYCRSSPEVEATCNVVRNTLRTTGNNLVFSRDNTDASEATWDNMDADGLLGVDYTIYPRNGRDM